ncbi:MAG: TonB-dependent receptor [Balneolaceae bacterium]
MKTIINLFLVIFCLSTASIAQKRTITVLDKMSKEPVINAHIIDGDEKVFAVTDVEGKVEISLEREIFKIHSLGYIESIIVLKETDDIIYLIPTILQAGQSVMVYAYGEKKANIKDYQSTQSHHTLDHFLDNIDGVAMIQRGAFGWEPSIRGQSDQRMNLNIDGMQIFKACVDKMDPISSYIESNNLSKLQIDKSGSSVAENGNGNSTINLISKKPDFAPFSLHLTSGLRVPDQYRVLALNSNYATETTAFQVSGSIKKADDFSAGRGSVIPNTQFNKMNLNVGVKQLLPSKNSVEVNFITDKATDVGYPALLMDATKALANILRVQYNWRDTKAPFQLTTAMLYGNTIRHWMDDDSRDVTQREVMRNMHMPMYGSTGTIGSKITGEATALNHRFEWFLNGFMSEANGDMWMISLDPNVEDMYIYNMDEIVTKNVSLGGRHSFLLSPSFLVKIEESASFTSLGTNSDNYASMFESLYNKAYAPRNRMLFSGSATAIWFPKDNWSLSLSSIYSERLGNHIELFGHYIYNYVDGYFYDGNPWLKSEKSVNFELNSTVEVENHSLSLSVFHKQYFDYISGKEVSDISNNDFQFKQYQNLGEAIMLGGEVRAINRFWDNLKTEVRASYTYAQNTTLNDPLPMIPPLKGLNSITYNFDTNNITASMEWAVAQTRISKKSSTESKTDGHAIFNLVYTKSLFDGSLSAIVEFKNIFDTYYSEHTSIASIPEAGRNGMLTLKYHY